MTDIELPVRAAVEIALEHGITPDRCDVLQNANTLVLRLSDTLVARVVQDSPRQGTAWYERENAVALHMARSGAPVIPLHPALPPGPYERHGFAINFWQFVTVVNAEPDAAEMGRTLALCHETLRSFRDPLPPLAILTETVGLLETLEKRGTFPAETIKLLRHHLTASIEVLGEFPHQPLHGDAHPGNLMNTTLGLLWTDWEDTFSGPVEWDLASLIWNPHILDGDTATSGRMLNGWREAGGHFDDRALAQSIIARGAVMNAWYPILYPNPNAERRAKLERRLEWMRGLRR